MKARYTMQEQWTDPKTGLVCEAVQHTTMGHFCGYVYLPVGHAKHGTQGDDLNVHGGVTYASREKDGRWKIGFDCAHLGDLVPSMPSRFEPEATFKDLPFVKEQLADLASQIEAVPTGRRHTHYEGCKDPSHNEAARESR